MALQLGGIFIWTYAYQLIRQSSVKYKAALDLEAATADEQLQFSKLEANRNIDANELSQLLSQTTTTLDDDDQDKPTSLLVASTTKSVPSNDIPQVVQILTMPQSSSNSSHLPKEKDEPFWKRWLERFHQLLEELLTPPTLAAIVGLVFGAVLWLKNLIIGDGAPLRVIQDSITILGDGRIPCITLILGGNLVQGLQTSTINPSIIVGVVCIRYMALPLIGILVVRAAASLGLLPSDPLFQYILMIQITLPPAMNIGTMTQLFDVAQEECSVMFLWTYLIAAPSLTAWSTVYMWILS